MDADIKGCYEQINKSWKAFEHNGKKMTKIQVVKVLEYGLAFGHKSVSEIPDRVVNSIVNNY